MAVIQEVNVLKEHFFFEGYCVYSREKLQPSFFQNNISLISLKILQPSIPPLLRKNGFGVPVVL